MNTTNLDTPCCGICGTSMVRIYRPQGFHYNPEDNRCNTHVEEIQRKYYIPCLIDFDGIPWGITAVPKLEAQTYMDLPEANPKGYSWNPKTGWDKE